MMRHEGRRRQSAPDLRRGDLVWVSDGLPGSTHDLTAAGTHDVITTPRGRGVDLGG